MRRREKAELDSFTGQQRWISKPVMLTGYRDGLLRELKWNFQASRMHVIKKAQAVDEAGPGYILSLRRMVILS